MNALPPAALHPASRTRRQPPRLLSKTWLPLLAVSATLLSAFAAPPPANAPAAPGPTATPVPYPADRVGTRGRLEAVVVEGNRAFSREAVLLGLLPRLDFHAAAHPEAPITAYTNLLLNHVTHGYRRAGFAEVAVHVATTPDRVRLDIREGTRFVAGPLRIEGLDTNLAQRLRARLHSALPGPSFKSSTTGSVDENLQVHLDPASNSSPRFTLAWPWFEGRPAPTDDPALAEMRATVGAVLASLGHPEAPIRVRIQTQPGRALADLLVEVDPPKTPPPVAPHPAAVASAPTPPVRTPEDAALLAFRDWLLARDRWTHDLVFEITRSRPGQPPFRLEGILVSDGLFLALPGTTHGPDALPRLAAVFSGRLQALYSPGRHARLLLPRFGPRFVLGIDMLPNPPGEEDAYGMTLGAFWGRPNAAEAEGPPFEIRMNLDPGAILALGRSEKLETRMHLEPGTLVLESPDEPIASRWRLEIDPASGRLLRWNLDLDDGESRISARLRTETGTFARRLQELAAATSGHPNAFDPEHPLRSSANFLLAELAAWSGNPAADQGLDALLGSTTAAVVRLLAALPAQGTLDLLDQDPAFAALDRGGEPFPAIVDATWFAAPAGTNPTMAFFGGLLLQFTRVLWPPGSWPQSLARDAILARVGYPDLVRASLERLADSPDPGPLGCLLAVVVLGEGNPTLASRLLETGVARLQSEPAAQDFATLLQGNTPGPRIGAALLRAFAAAPDSDIPDLGEVLGRESVPLLAALHDIAKATPPSPLSQTLPDAVRRRWNHDLVVPLRTALEARPPGVREPVTPAGQFVRGASLAHGLLGPADLSAAIPWVRRAAEAGYGQAQLVYGDLHAGGEGLARDPGEAALWYRRAAARHVPHAACRLGNLHLEGQGVPKDPEEASRWFALDATNDCPNALFQLGRIALDHSPPDWETATRWFRRAAALDHPPALYFLGKRAEDTGRTRDALRSYEAAARLGFVPAQADLGDRLGDGLTPGQNPVQAWAWLHLAVQGGHRISAASLERIEKQLTPDQLAEARRRADALASRLKASTPAPPAAPAAR